MDKFIIQKIIEICREIKENKKEILNNLDQESIDVYVFLRKEFDNNNQITSNYLFQFLFWSYYGLDNAGLTKEFKKEFFNLMEHREENLSKILSILYKYKNKRGLNTIQFSFSSKLINMVNKNKPLIDSKVSKLMNLSVNGKSKEEKIKSRILSYEKLELIMNELLKKEDILRIISDFRTVFKVSDKEINDVKVLDYLLWSLGDLKEKEKKNKK